MSYDLALQGGDIQFGSDGNPILVYDKDKLGQDVGKILLTPLGSDPAAAQYGSDLRNVLGANFDLTVLQGLVAKSVGQALNYLSSLQLVQGVRQSLSYDEVIGSVDALSVSSPAYGKIAVQVAITTMSGLRSIFAIDLSS